jgi:Amt family ammonium transporter
VKTRFGYDDSLDAFAVHGIGGTWGAIATGLFANPAINSAGKGLFFGNPGQVITQLIAVAASWVLAFVGTYIILKILDVLMGLRVAPEEEQTGLDLSQHKESAYTS